MALYAVSDTNQRGFYRESSSNLGANRSSNEKKKMTYSNEFKMHVAFYSFGTNEKHDNGIKMCRLLRFGLAWQFNFYTNRGLLF